MKVLLFTGFFLPGFKGGGPIKTIKNMVQLVNDNISYSIVTKDRDLGDNAPYASIASGRWVDMFGCSIFYLELGVRGLYQMWHAIRLRSYDIVYLNSFFSPHFSLFPLIISKVFRRRIIIAPRGELSPGAITIRSAKKKAFIRMYRYFGMQSGVVFQASSEYEADDIKRALGVEVDVFVAENVGSQEFAKYIFENKTRQLNVVFLSRLSPKKNLIYALEVLRSVSYPVRFHVYGPIEDFGYWEECKKLIQLLPAHVEVEYLGLVVPENVVATLARYDLFFMPTKSENYGHVIAEALCAGLPLLIADTTPWRGLQKKGLGWDLALAEPESFVSALDELAVMPREQHLRMRENVLAWANKKFSQKDAIEANIAMFRYAYEKK